MGPTHLQVLQVSHKHVNQPISLEGESDNEVNNNGKDKKTQGQMRKEVLKTQHQQHQNIAKRK